MRPKSLILLILALGCGLVAAIGINQVMANRSTQNSGASGETTPIFVAVSDIGMGDPLTPQVLKLEEWPKGKVPPGAMDRLEDIEGRRTKTRFYTGEPIIEAKLFGKGNEGGAATDLIPKGFRVVAVKVDVNSGSGLILPGDRVDVLVHLQEQPGRHIDGTGTRTFLQNVKVFAVNDIFCPRRRRRDVDHGQDDLAAGHAAASRAGDAGQRDGQDPAGDAQPRRRFEGRDRGRHARRHLPQSLGRRQTDSQPDRRSGRRPAETAQ